MNQPDDPIRETEAALERLSRLSEASLRINESRDVDTVLWAVMEGARSLMRVPYAAITTVDTSSRVEHYLALGLDADDLEQLWQAPGGTRFFEYLNDLPRTLRVGQLEDLLVSIGVPELHLPVSITAFMATPILHEGVRVGNIYVGSDEAGKEFTQEDEETLVMFASQAAQAIANARRHRDEQRSRVDLETLVDTSPVGVVVIDAETGILKSFNREARRIVDSLRNPNQSHEDLLDVVTFRRANGEEFSLKDLSLSDILSAGEIIRAEEITLRVPDGRTVSLLLNATPIISDSGTVESMVVTLQDMAAIEELERMRAEFLALVSHELRAPLTSIKGSAATVLDSSEELDPAVVRQFFRIIGDQADHMHSLVSDLLDVARIETGTLPVSPEPAEVAVLVDRARSAFVSAGGRNNLDINIDLALPLVMADRRRIVQVIGNLLTNAARHSPESSVIRVTAMRQDVYVAFSVTDEGRGIPAENMPHLFRKFARIHSEDQREDTGLGLAICKGIVEAHGGRIWAESEGPGLGARFTFTLPTVNGGINDIAGGGLHLLPRLSRQSARTASERVRVLVVDDDPEALRYVRDTLNQSGYTPIVTGDPEEALSLMEDKKPALILLDLMLPGIDGIRLMEDLLTIAEVPVIFLSVYGQEDIIVKAFDMGAVDYMVKPFVPTELLARIRAALRRQIISEPLEPYVHGELTIDYAERQVTLAGRLVELMAIEYRMLVELSASAGRVVTQDQLLQRVWGERSGGDVRPMRTIVSRLRRKLGDDADNPTYIFTEPRVGYWMPKGETPEET